MNALSECILYAQRARILILCQTGILQISLADNSDSYLKKETQYGYNIVRIKTGAAVRRLFKSTQVSVC